MGFCAIAWQLNNEPTQNGHVTGLVILSN